MQEAVMIISEDVEEYRDLYSNKLHEYFPDQALIFLRPEKALAGLIDKSIICTTMIIAIPVRDSSEYLSFISNLHTASPDILMILLLQYGCEGIAQRAMRMGAHDFLIKPVAMEKLRLCISHAMTIHHLRTYIQRLEQHISTQSGITAEEKQRIMLGQMQSFLVDERGDIKPLHVLEQEIIKSVLRYSGGCVSRAARSLGIGRSTLYRKVDVTKEDAHQKQRESQTARPMYNVSSRSVPLL